MRDEMIKVIVVAIAIIIAALLHALIVRDTGRYLLVNGERIDTRTGEVFHLDQGQILKPLR